jgi:hypothetical protein
MNTTRTSIQELEAGVQRLVREHLEAVRAAVTLAAARVFAGEKRSLAKASAKPTNPRRRRMSGRRPAKELAELSDRFCAAVDADPGATMATLGPVVDATARELQVVVAKLRRGERIRTVGRRQQMKYFPVAPALASAS